MRRIVFLLAAVLFTAALAAPAHADGLYLSKVIVHFMPGQRPIDNINVTNQSDKTLRVTVQTIKVTHAGMPDQKNTPTHKLIVAPESFEIAPGETRPVRLVLRGFPDNLEDVYRIRFSPNLPTIEKKQVIAGKTVQINVIVSMGALIMAEPKNPKPDLSFKRQGDVITFINKGNVTATLQRDNYCLPDGKTCVDLEGMRLFPGNSWTMKVPAALKNLPFTQTMQSDGQYSTLSYPAP